MPHFIFYRFNDFIQIDIFTNLPQKFWNSLCQKHLILRKFPSYAIVIILFNAVSNFLILIEFFSCFNYIFYLSIQLLNFFSSRRSCTNQMWGKKLYTILNSLIYAFRYIPIDFPAYIKLVVSILNTYYTGSRQNGKSILQFHIIFFTIKLETWSILIQTCSLILPYTDFSCNFLISGCFNICTESYYYFYKLKFDTAIMEVKFMLSFRTSVFSLEM